MSDETKRDAARAELSGNRHIPLQGEHQKARTDPNAELQVTLLLRRKQELPDLHADFGARLPHKRRHLTHLQLGDRHGATPEDIASVERFAAEHGLRVAASYPRRRTVVLRGRAADLERAFDVNLVEIEHKRGHYRAATGTASVPQELRGIVRAAMGLNTRPCAHRRMPHHNSTQPYWTVQQMAEAYGFPREMNAAGERIALIELGGGYHEDDLRRFFSEVHAPMPVIRSVSVNGVQNTPAPPQQIRQLLDVMEGKCRIEDVPADVLSAAQCTAEVTMDIELAAALALGAEIVVYFAPADEQGIHDALSQALSDSEGAPSAISISWGEPETDVSGAYILALEEVLRDAAMLGVTVCASSGDDGAMNDAEGKPTVNFPACSPHALSCGGSSVDSAEGDGFRESVWNCMVHGMHGATGGGVSRNFPLPQWQQSHNVPASPTGSVGRGVPDVAGPADPHRGCAIVVGGQICASAGTSSVAPMWAALVAILNHELGARCGYITPLLYELAGSGTGVLREITVGDNGFYKAGHGWNACTGLGSPHVERLAQMLRSGHDHPIDTDTGGADLQVTNHRPISR